ncbi:MAG: outer membrane protein [Blastocatellales bacterium]
MQKLFFILCCLLITVATAYAQPERRYEFFGGYSNLQAEGIPDRDSPGSVFDDNFFERRKGLHGFEISGGGYFTSTFGLKGDFSFHTDKDSTDFVGGSDSIKTQVYYFLGGPMLRFANGNRVEPFVHAMAGGANTRFEAESVRMVTGGLTRSSFETNATDFAIVVGGGVDIRVNDWLSVRAAQIDWAPVFFRDRTINVLGSAGVIVPLTLDGQRQDNLRFSAGVVF